MIYVAVRHLWHLANTQSVDQMICIWHSFGEPNRLLGFGLRGLKLWGPEESAELSCPLRMAALQQSVD